MSEVSDLTGRMRRQARQAARDLPKMEIGGHLEDAAGQVEQGNTEGAERHLRAAMQSLTPRNLYRHGHMTDDDHQTARGRLALLDRHLLGVRDLADMNAPASNPIGRPSGTAWGPGQITEPAGHPMPARSWIAAGQQGAGPKLMSNMDLADWEYGPEAL